MRTQNRRTGILTKVSPIVWPGKTSNNGCVPAPFRYVMRKGRLPARYYVHLQFRIGGRYLGLWKA